MERQQRLLATGRNPPSEGDADDPDASPNYFVQTGWPVPVAAVADLAVRTFRDVHGVAHPGWLSYKAFTHVGEPIRFPNLRITREDG